MNQRYTRDAGDFSKTYDVDLGVAFSEAVEIVSFRLKNGIRLAIHSGYDANVAVLSTEEGEKIAYFFDKDADGHIRITNGVDLYTAMTSLLDHYETEAAFQARAQEKYLNPVDVPEWMKARAAELVTVSNENMFVYHMAVCALKDAAEEIGIASFPDPEMRYDMTPESLKMKPV